MARRTVLCVVVTALVAVGCTRKPAGPDIGGLVEQLKGTDEARRGRAATELITIGEPAVPALVELLRDPDPRYRRAAASTLWGLGLKGKAAVPQLADALSDPDPEVRGAAALALHAMGREARAAVPALIAAIRDQDRNVRVWAIKSLGAIGPEAEPALSTIERYVKDDFLGIAAKEAVAQINAATSARDEEARRKKPR
jgi:HEAT repeat protein